MKVLRIFVKTIKRRQVHAAAKPAHGFLAGVTGSDHAHVHVHRGHIGVARVKHQRYAHGFKRGSRQFGPVRRSRGRQARAPHMRKATASALEYAAPFDDFGDAIALQQLPWGLVPGVDQSTRATLAFHGFEGANDAGLQTDQVTAHARCGISGVEARFHPFLMARWPMSRRY